MRPQSLAMLLFSGSLTAAAAGCFSLSLGGKTCTGTSPETQARITAIEQRVSAIEQMLPAPTVVYTQSASP